MSGSRKSFSAAWMKYSHMQENFKRQWMLLTRKAASMAKKMTGLTTSGLSRTRAGIGDESRCVFGVLRPCEVQWVPAFHVLQTS